MARPVHRDEARKFAYGVGTLLLLLVVAVVGVIVQTGGALPGKRYTYVKAAFHDVGILKSGKAVKENGIRIGLVSGVEYVEGTAVVTLRLDGSRDVYQDATAAVSNVSALGKKYVELDPGTPDAGELGDGTLPLDQTEDSVALEDVLSALDPKTRKALQATLGELGGGLAGHGEDLHALLRSLPGLLPDVETVTAALSGPDADLPGLLYAADTLAGRFAGRTGEIEALLRQADETVAALAMDGGAPLEESVAALPPTLQEAKLALDALHAPLVDARSALDNLQPGGVALGRSSGDLRGFLRESVRPLERVPGVSGLASPAVDHLAGALVDARPVVPQVSRSIASLAKLLFDFAPYAGDAGRFVAQNDLLSGTLGSDDKHYFAAMLTGLGLFSLNGAPDPLATNEYYPVPGTAWNHSTITGVGQ